MTDGSKIIAYRYKGEWYLAGEVQANRTAFVDASPYTIDMLKRRREYGRDVPEWVKLDKEER